MRTLVACPKCNRQYDAEGLSVGKKFHCHCGSVLKVEQAKGLDASVVCCSQCGAPRMKGSLSCDHCDADFTLHERDLDTVCPQCMARVSDKARFCHHCGKRINPEMVAGEKSELCCPVCKPTRPLISRSWGDISILECNRCAGMWLSHDSFRIATEQAAAETKDASRMTAPRNARAPNVDAVPPDGGKRYRPCVVCNQLMQRQQFGRGSGVIIDLCKNHGLWFDADELSRIIDWIQTGGAAQAEREEETDRAREEALERRKAANNVGKKRVDQNPWASDGGAESFLEEAIRWLFRV